MKFLTGVTGHQSDYQSDYRPDFRLPYQSLLLLWPFDRGSGGTFTSRATEQTCRYVPPDEFILISTRYVPPDEFILSKLALDSASEKLGNFG